ncbi:response regulator [Halorubellus sp. PRR65]|uniref:response regulator n=1 Tax=Halorubellus sp. PRR65 TaxID=3098148 RepID=UPI002B259861|nr:response regulator [Halorubellus sp. PRR65]
MVSGGVSGSGRVVVVDDEERVADVYATFLSDEHDVEVAYDGDAALDVVDADVDVVLLDRRMPGMHGDEVLDRLRDRGYDGRVVMVTALNPGYDVVDMAFEQYVCKPIAREELRTVVRRELLRSNYDDALQEYLRVQSKVTTIAENHPDPAAVEHPRVRALRERLDEIRDGLLETLVEHAELEYESESGPVV